MSPEQNKLVVRRLWMDVWNNADLGVADEIFDSVYAEHEKTLCRYGAPHSLIVSIQLRT